MATDPVADNILQLVDATDDCKCPSAPTASAEEGEAEIESADVPEAEEAAEDEAAPGDEPDAEGAALAELSAKETHPLSMALHAASAIHQEDTFAKGGKNVVSIFAQYPDEEGKHALKGALALTTFEEAHDLPDKSFWSFTIQMGMAGVRQRKSYAKQLKIWKGWMDNCRLPSSSQNVTDQLSPR